MDEKVGAVIVAAGMSKRMKQFKQLMKAGDMTFAERVVVNFRRAGVRDIVMVTGFRAEMVEKSLQSLGVVFLRNEQYETTQMFDSAKIGLAYLRDRVDRVFFCPVDVPFFLEDTVRLELTRKEEIVFPICHNRLGHPILFDAGLIPAILDYPGEHGLKGALDSVGTQRACYLPVPDEGTVMDADTPSDYQYLLDMQNARLMRAEVRVTLAKQKPFFGPGTDTLLRQVDTLGSVREACAKTSISYSKGWTMIHQLEKETGYPVVERLAGGKNGGSAHLTERGRELLAMYELLEKRVSENAAQEFCNIFSAGELYPKSSRESTAGESVVK